MSFCPFCQAQLSLEESQSKYCAYCGRLLQKTQEAAAPADYPTEDDIPQAQAQPQPQAQPQATPVFDAHDIKTKVTPIVNQLVGKAKTLDKKYYPVIIAVPVALIAFIVVIVMFFSSSYMTPMNDFFKLANKQTIDVQELTYSLSPDFRVSLMKKVISNADFAFDFDTANDSLEDIYDTINDKYDEWEIGFKVKSKEKMDIDDVEELEDTWNDYFDDDIDDDLDDMADMLDDDDEIEDFADSFDLTKKEAKNYIKSVMNYYKSFKNVKITEAYEVKGKFTIKADEDKFESDTVKVYLVKINGDWAYAGLDDDDYITFDEDDIDTIVFNQLFNYLRPSYLGPSTMLD